jgi:GyrI-like small molecule binding domain
MTDPRIVEREEIDVQFVAVADGIEQIRRAWEELETAVGSLRGRRFYGAFYPATDEYRACVQVREGDDPVPGLETGTLPGGRYLRARLTGEPPGVYERIAPTFRELLQQGEHDPGRPSLEHYRRVDEIDLLLPVP